MKDIYDELSSFSLDCKCIKSLEFILQIKARWSWCYWLILLLKVIVTHKILANGIPADIIDEYLRIGENTVIESLRAFIKTIVKVFSNWYLRASNKTDIA